MRYYQSSLGIMSIVEVECVPLGLHDCIPALCRLCAFTRSKLRQGPFCLSETRWP